MAKKQVDVIVLTMDSELNFTIQPSTTGKDLFNQVANAIHLREVWYFGFQYIDNKGLIAWLKPNKKVLQHKLNRTTGAIQFSFRARFYPECAEEEILQDVTLRLFYLQIKVLILSGEIYCDPENALMLASYAIQVKYGEFDPQLHKPGFLAKDRLLPMQVTNQYRLSKEEWEGRVMKLWAKHGHMERESAMMEYLKVAQELDMYGVNYFDIKNRKGTGVFLGIHADGLNVYPMNNKLEAKIAFKWSEVRTLSFSGKKFAIKLLDESAKDFILFSKHVRMNKDMLSLCVGNHELFMRRRSPISTELQRIKEEALQEKILRQLERDQLIKETKAREEAELKQQEYEERMFKMKEEMDRAQHDLVLAQEIIAQLELQLRELNEYKRELKVKEEELFRLNDELKSERQMNEDERSRLIDDITSREYQITEMRSQIDVKATRAEELQKEIHRRQSQQFHSSYHSVASSIGDSGSEIQAQEHVELQQTVEDTNHQSFTEQDKVENCEKKVQNNLEVLAKELCDARDPQMMTELDHAHMERKKSGRDKRRTLREIRSGNTRRRVDQFENM